jgi:hypothetical protein
MVRIYRTAVILLLALALLLPASPRALAAPLQQAPSGSWLAQYWNGIDLAGAPAVQRIESAINHNWGAGSPDPAIQSDFFSARWTGSFSLPAGTYRLRTRSDDGMRVRVNNQLVIDDWVQHAVTERMAEIQLAAGLHTFVIEYFEYQGEAVAAFWWEPVIQPTPVGVSISPTSGPAGAVVQVHAWGFGPYAQVAVSVAPQGGAAVHSHTVAANASGQLWTTVTMPGSAAAGSLWVVMAAAGGQQGTSPAFRVEGGAPPTTSPCGSRYTVRPGDWLYQIARTCQVTVADLLRANPQISNASLLYPGQVLNIPQVGTPPPPPPVSVTATTRYALNFRPAPSLGSTPMAVIPAGVTVPVLARGPDGWIYVRYGARQGWIAGWLCNIHGNLGGLPYRAS